MCSNICARPVLPMGSCTEPASTLVKKEKTGALPGRVHTIAVSPLGSFLTVTRFSNDDKSCAEAAAARTIRLANTTARCFKARDIGPPGELARRLGER